MSVAREKFRPPRKDYKPVWFCIYCGTPHARDKPLGKEHIIPYALAGAYVLPRSSCTPCSRLTKAFEETCTRRMFGALRTVLDVQTRRPHQRPKSLPIIMKHGAYDQRVEVPIQDYPFITIVLPDFNPPRLLTGDVPLQHPGLQWRVFHGLKRDARNPLPFSNPTVGIPARVDVFAFYKLLAKIAHSFAVAELGLDAFEWLLPPLILGKATNFSDLIGGTELLTGGEFKNIPIDKPKAIHRIGFQEMQCLSTQQTYLVATIGLLYDCTPDYHVVVATVPRW